MPSDFEDLSWDALLLWEAANKVRETKSTADRQLKELSKLLFTLNDDEWNAWCADFVGRGRDLRVWLMSEPYDTAKVNRFLFKDKKIKTETLPALVAGLVKFGITHKVELPIGGIKTTIAEYHAMLKRKQIEAWLCRWLVSCRQLQVKENMRRNS